MPARDLVPAIGAVVVNVHDPAALNIASELASIGTAIIRVAITTTVIPVVLIITVALGVSIILIIPVALTVSIVSARVILSL